jgi:hypothetical protein
MKRFSHYALLYLVSISASCSMIAKGASAAGGAAVGAAVGGPPGAAIGGGAGYLSAEIYGPDAASGPFSEAPPPTDVWSLLGLLVDKAYWLVVLAGLAYLAALMLPPVTEWRIPRAFTRRK